MTQVSGSFLRGLSDEAGARVLVVEATAAADEVRRRHGLGRNAAQAAAEGLVAAQLMSAYIKGQERITLQVQSESPRFSLIVDVNSDGTTRGRFTPSHIPKAGSFEGAVMIIKHDADKELYRGVAPVERTGFQGALQAYLVRSQQSVGVVRIVAETDGEGRVLSARGLLVEKLPDQQTDLFHELFSGLETAALEPVLAGVFEGELWGFPLQILENRELRFHCPCCRDRSLDILASLGIEELGSLLEEQGGAELTCNFCCEIYTFSASELSSLILGLTATES